MTRSSNTQTDIDKPFMNRALSLAEKGLYTVTPNPAVGCIIVKDNEIIAEGWHQKAGAPHAEVVALQSLDPKKAKDSTMYVSLEPCCHKGKTGPCVEQIVKYGISRVVIACLDPNPLVNHKGVDFLRQHGIDVEYGVCEKEARELIAGFLHRMKTGLPLIRMKAAISLDGKTALKNGQSQWITSIESREDVHHWRAISCCVITGIGTILSDDPALNVRHKETTRQPTLVFVDRLIRIPLDAKCLSLLSNRPVIVFYGAENLEKQRLLEDKGVEVVLCPLNENKLVEISFVIEYLGRKKLMNDVLVEAGSNLISSFFQANIFDEIICYIAPKALGHNGRPMVYDHKEHTSIDEIQNLSIKDVVKIGPDIRVTYKKAD